MFYSLVKAIAFVVFNIVFRIKVEGKQNIPGDGRIVLCSNHKSNWDPLILAAMFPRKISWMGKKELFENKFLKVVLNWLGVFPVDRQVADLSAVKTALRILKSEKVLGIFPEGTRVTEYNPENAKAGVALLAMKSQAPVLPVYIEGSYKLFSRLEIVIGEPMEYHKKYTGRLGNEEYSKISQEILAKIYKLGG
ncbi:MAG TPA: lysophospholipid acyltransferase family protein [Tissierellaceae bacterium]|nr:lysophospholipid acyltransferase family protein [Tissierellaceae bacterium]